MYIGNMIQLKIGFVAAHSSGHGRVNNAKYDYLCILYMGHVFLNSDRVPTRLV